MPLTAIDQTPALVVIDLQKGLVAIDTTPYELPIIINRSAQLASAFRRRGFPVVLVTATGVAPGRTDRGISSVAVSARSDDFADVVDDLGPNPGDHLVTKQTWGAFQNTGLHELLTVAGVTQVVIVGVATSAGVESTGRAAHERGYNVVIVTDAVGDRTLQSHVHSVERIFPKLAETCTAADVLAMVERAV